MLPIVTANFNYLKKPTKIELVTPPAATLKTSCLAAAKRVAKYLPELLTNEEIHDTVGGRVEANLLNKRFTPFRTVPS